MPFVSFCFTTYKRPCTLIETVKSILLQSFTDYEVIISDNDPEQSGKKITEVITDPRVKYFANNENLGMKKSFNKSLERSSGEYIVMIADDDPVYPEMLETLIKLYKDYPGYGVYTGACNWFCTNVEIAKLFNIKVGANSYLANLDVDTVRTFTANEFLIDFFNFKILPNYLWSTAMVKREILIEKGGVPDYGTAFLGDYAYLSIMASHSGCVVINRALGHQTIHNENFGRAQNEQIKTACVNFVDYVSKRINHLKDWAVIEQHMKRFVALWAFSHMAFLHGYFKKNAPQEMKGFLVAEKEVFDVPFIKPLKTKYLLKKSLPAVHDAIVAIKKRL